MTTFAMKRTVVGWALGLSVITMVTWAAVAAIQRPAVLPPSRLLEGSISEIRGAPFGLNITQTDGSTRWLAMDPMETVVLQGGRVAEFETLEKGQQVKARYATKDGKEVARSIEIVDPLPMMTAPVEQPAAPETQKKPMSEF